MKVKSLDHLVLTTENLGACLRFYTDVLGMEAVHENNRHALKFGQQKIIIHTRKAEFMPAAKNPQSGALDICLVAEEPIEMVYRELMDKRVTLETGIVARNGARGRMKSIYLRDPDGNLVEICSYME